MTALINPTTGDYNYMNGRVQLDPTNGLANAVYLRLMTPLGGWWRDATLGSRLHELVRQKDLSRISVLAKQYAQTALQPIVDDGRALKIEVSTEQLHNGRLNLLVEVTSASNEVLTFKHPVKVY